MSLSEQNILSGVKKSYSLIASEFAQTRHRHMNWPEFDLFKKYLKIVPNKKLNLLDLGCGNGRLFAFLDHKKIQYLGIDNNTPLLKIAKKNNPTGRFKKGDMLNIPARASSFDSVWCIAALHHLPTRALQKKALLQMKKVLKKGGTLMFTVWNLWQPKYKAFIDKKSHHSLIPWGNPAKAFRFYYAFTSSEIESLLKEVGFSKIKRVSTRPNLAYICTK